MFSYIYKDYEDDTLVIKEADGGGKDAAYIVSNNGIGVYVPADEAPKAAQAILDAAGVQGVVIVGSNINVTLGAKAKAKAEAEAESEDAELKALEELKAKIEAKKAHDALRTSPIALKALAIYNRACIGCGPYESWDATLDGDGVGEWTVRHFIGLAEEEEAKEKEAAEKLAARRDELVRNHAKGLDAYCYDDLDVNGKYLVDRLRIALDEGKDAKGVKAA